MFIVKSLQASNSADDDIFPSSVIIMTFVVLVVHLLWEKIGLEFAICIMIIIFKLIQLKETKIEFGFYIEKFI